MGKKLEKALAGTELGDGWVIQGRRVKFSGGAGACHAVGFTAEHPDGRRAFVWVMDPTPDPTLVGLKQFKELADNDLLSGSDLPSFGFDTLQLISILGYAPQIFLDMRGVPHLGYILLQNRYRQESLFAGYMYTFGGK